MPDVHTNAVPKGLDLERECRQIREKDWRIHIDGRPITTKERYTTTDPATEERLADVPDAQAADVAAAVEAGERGFENWRRIPPRDRAATIRQMAQVLRDNATELAILDSLDSGNPLTATLGDVAWSAELMEIAADGAISHTSGRTIPVTTENLHLTVREPYGVVARIIPFNHPVLFTAAKIAPALVAGNAVVVKAPPQTPLAPLRLAELFEDLLPRGVLSVITGNGPETGDALVRHPAVKRIAFIGSVPTGRAIQKAAAESGVKHVTLELGGKNPLVVFPDADIDRAAEAVVRGMNFKMSQGQSCGSTSRVIVHKAVHEELVAAALPQIEGIRMGHPLESGVEMGPLVSEQQFEKSRHYIREGIDAGAGLLTGGGRPPERDRGWFVSPTVFDDVEPSMSIAQEEIFGPVMSVMTFRDEEEALRIANGVDYGLTASIWTNDVHRAHRLARGVEAGYVWINEVARHFWGTPFGGYKSSGIGLEEGPEEILSFTQSKTIHVMVGG